MISYSICPLTVAKEKIRILAFNVPHQKQIIQDLSIHMEEKLFLSIDLAKSSMIPFNGLICKISKK